MAIITSTDLMDLRFPTSESSDGSDAVNKDVDYSAAYIRLVTEDSEFHGCGFTFTIGRGNEICLQAIEAQASHCIGYDVAELVYNLDLSYLSDELAADEAIVMLEEQRQYCEQRIDELKTQGFPCYTTSAGWLGYSDEKLARLCRGAMEEGYRHIKLKVGANPEDDERRLGIARSVIDPSVSLMIDHIAVSGPVEGRVAEFVDHLHEHFVDPCIVKRGAYTLPTLPGYSAQIKSESLAAWEWPEGSEWAKFREDATP